MPRQLLQQIAEVLPRCGIRCIALPQRTPVEVRESDFVCHLDSIDKRREEVGVEPVEDLRGLRLAEAYFSGKIACWSWQLSASRIMAELK